MRWIKERVSTVLLKYVPGAQKADDEVVTHYYQPLLEISLPLLPGLFFMSDHVNTQGMCDKEVDVEPSFLELVPDRLKTKGMCNKAVRSKPYTLRYVLDWIVIQHLLKIWHDDDEDKFFEWYDGYKKRKAQKASIKEELLPIPWHPSRYWDWFMSENEKQEVEICGDKCRLVCV